MRGMLVKDIRFIIQQKQFFCILLVLAIILNFTADGTFVIGYLSFVSTFFVITTLGYDEHANGYAFLMTLPVMRKTYVREKYIFGLMLGCSGWAAGVIISFIYLILHGDKFSVFFFLAEAALLLPVFVLIMAVMIPFQLKFGGEKGKIAVLIFCGIVCAVSFFAASIFDGAAGVVAEKLSLLSRHNMGILVMLFLIISFIAAFISCAISCRIMCKKEF